MMIMMRDKEEEEGKFVEWREEIISGEKGKRVVHFYLKDTLGNSVLAVEGTERSVRHMTYVVPDHFVDNYGGAASLSDVTYGTKWRSRREVVDWLTLIVSDHRSRLPGKSACGILQPVIDQTGGSCGPLLPRPPEMPPRKLKAQISCLVWNGLGWLCAKQLMHYHSFCRSGVNISVHSFVFIMAVDGNPYIGYIEDMYEDKKTQKKVKVRWFHRSEEVLGVVPQLIAHPREVFITPQVQVINAHCIDGPASVLTPKHYEQCVDVLPHSILCRVHMCFRQLKNNMIQPFSISKLQGYSNQAVVSCINHPLFSKNKTNKTTGRHSGQDKQDNSAIGDFKPGHKRKRPDGGKNGGFKVNNRSSTASNQNTLCRPETSLSAFGSQVTKAETSYPKLTIKLSGKILKHGDFVGSQPELSSSFKINDEIELLCQDSGIRGCWFRCKVLQVSRKCLKVEYDDLQDAENSGNLQEWVASCRVAAPDKLGIRYSGRLTTRPRPPEDSGGCIIEVGAPVDIWWHDGWWEGIVITTDVSGADRLQVYLSGEDRFVTVEKSYVRSAKDWVNGSWVYAKIKSDILSCVSVKAKPSISDCDMLPSLELAEVEENGEDAPSGAALYPVPTSFGDDTALERHLHKGETIAAENDKQPLKDSLGRDVDKDANDGVDVENDFIFARQQYVAPVKCVEVPVS